MKRLTVTLLLSVVLAVMATGASSTCAHAQLTRQGSYAGDYRLYLQNEQEFSHAAHRLILLPKPGWERPNSPASSGSTSRRRPAVDDPSGLSTYEPLPLEPRSSRGLCGDL